MAISMSDPTLGIRTMGPEPASAGDPPGGLEIGVRVFVPGELEGDRVGDALAVEMEADLGPRTSLPPQSLVGLGCEASIVHVITVCEPRDDFGNQAESLLRLLAGPVASLTDRTLATSL